MAVADATGDTNESASRSRSKIPIILGLLLAVGVGAGGFFAAYTGLLPIPAAHEEQPEAAKNEGNLSSEISFVPLDPMVVSLGGPGRGRHLRFRAQVEVVPGRGDDVRDVMPRIIDTLNGYLRAVPIDELETPSALVPLRAQMLRRVQLVTAQGAVRDLLIMEFVLN